MSKKNIYAGLLRGTLAQFLKDALSYFKDPAKLTRLLATVIVYARKNKVLVKTFIKDILLLREMLYAWLKGEYKVIPQKTILLVITALLYFVSPIDLIPDWLPGGFMDDAALITWVLQSIRMDIQKFVSWKEREEKALPSFV
jgi:uncharacterized membrane protein YkvA (DUF1232 family)